VKLTQLSPKELSLEPIIVISIVIDTKLWGRKPKRPYNIRLFAVGAQAEAPRYEFINLN
jgi:hypothetical protein